VRAALEACVDAHGPVTVLAQRLKNRLTLVEAPSMHDLMGLLELAKVCVCLFVDPRRRRRMSGGS
jgi:hypothetical protein